MDFGLLVFNRENSSMIKIDSQEFWANDGIIKLNFSEKTFNFIRLKWSYLIRYGLKIILI
jgi:hypothetical protein